MEVNALIAIISIAISIVAMFVAIIALVYTAKTFLLKSGLNIRGLYSICSNIACDDKYISSVTLENLKDRAIVVFKIYLKLGHNYFVEVENFENSPLILKPFEVFKKEYDPIDLYSFNSKRILLDKLLDDNSVKKQLVLSTSDGKYNIKEEIVYWDPVIMYFKNHMTGVIQPRRSGFKGKAYGSNVKFIVEFKNQDGNEEIVPIYPRDYEIKKFKLFKLTKESLESREALEAYLYEKAIEHKINCNDIAVHELESLRNDLYKDENIKVIKVSYHNWFMYYIIGRIYTMFSDYRLKRLNKAAKGKITNQIKPKQ